MKRGGNQISLLIIFLVVPFYFVVLISGGIARQAPDTAVTFSKDVAPILYRHCVECHRPGTSPRCRSDIRTPSRTRARSKKK
ncbi:MAG: hypothetical protein WKF30_16020 [Pyrinomonadaceae bacterium]